MTDHTMALMGRVKELEAELARYQNLRQCPYCDEPNTTTEHAEVCAKNPARKMSHAELIAMNESHQRALNELNKSSYLHAATAVNHPVKVVWEDGSYPPGTKLYVKTEPKQ